MVQKKALLLTIAILTLVACNKKPNYPTIFLDPVLKLNFDNKPGSYWLYRDSVTGETDSIYITDRLLHIEDHYPNEAIRYECLYLNSQTVQSGTDTSARLQIYMSFSANVSQPYSGNLLDCRINDTAFHRSLLWFYYPFKLLMPIDGDTVETLGTQNVRLAGRNFDSTVVIRQYNRWAPDNSVTVYWHNLFGVVKLRFYKKERGVEFVKVFEIERYKLIK